MSVNPDLFIHESDRTALNALKAIPGFTPLLKGFMKIWNEKQFKLMNMSTLVRISEKQMPEYYDMLNNPAEYKRYSSFAEAMEDVLDEV